MAENPEDHAAEPAASATTWPGPAVVLVEPQLGENIGMVARAMANFGLIDLRLVNPRDGWPSEKARAAASSADHVIDAVRLFDSVEAAVADLTYLLATTARPRDSYKPVRGPETAAGEMRAREAAGQKVGILFGRERYGLSNAEVGLADEIVTFPVDPAFASLNIAQAVLLMSYSWRAAGADDATAPRFTAPAAPPAEKADLYRLLDHLETSLSRTGYFHPPEKREAMVQNLRTMLTKAGFTEPEVRTLRGVLRAFDYEDGRTRPVRPGDDGLSAPILVFDSGIGGLTVLRELRIHMPDRKFIYVADDAGFPYGDWQEDRLRERIVSLFGELVPRYAPQLAVIACNTASTLVLEDLRGAFDIPFVGTVPAIKPAAERTRSGLISVLATPGTVRRDYTRDLIGRFAGHCAVRLVGSSELARLTEQSILGGETSDDAIAAEIASCFVEEEGRRTDIVVLACTHYPLIANRFRQLAPWPVDWLDPAEAIARRARSLSPAADDEMPEGFDEAHFTSGEASYAMRRLIRGFGLEFSGERS